MLLHEKDKFVNRDPDLDLVLVCSHDIMANMDAKEQADQIMAAAEALCMISTRGNNKGRDDVATPRKSKRGRKAKKPRNDFEEGIIVKSEETRSLFETEGGGGKSISVNKNNQYSRGQSQEGEISTANAQNATNSTGKGLVRVGARSQVLMYDDTPTAAGHVSGVDKTKRKERSDYDINVKDANGRFKSKSMHITNADGKTVRGNGKRGRGLNSSSGHEAKSIKKSSTPAAETTTSAQKAKASRAGRGKHSGVLDNTESLPSGYTKSRSRSRSISEDKKSSGILKSEPPPKKLGRFRDKSGHTANNAASDPNSENETKTEFQALGFTGVAVTLVKSLPKGGKSISTIAQRKNSIDVNAKVTQVNSSASSTNINSTDNVPTNSNLTNTLSLPSLTSEVANLPSLPIGIESLQLSSSPMPNLSSLSGLKGIKISDDKTSEDVKTENDKAQKVLPLKKRKLHSQNEVEEKVVEDASDNDSDETMGDQDNSPSVSSRSHVQTKFTVQAHPMITMQTLMEINTALSPDEDGDLPLHIAVVHENMRMVTKLINLMKIAVKGVDKFNKQQQTPLHLAVKLNFLPAVALLISSGASINTVDGTGSSAVHMAVQGRYTKCLEYMLRTCPGAEVNGRNFEGLSPLHLAVDNNDLEQVRLLLKYGADIDLADGKSGRTALFHAAETNQKQMVEMLLKEGANPDVPNYAGVTTTMAAQGRNLHGILKLIGSVTQEIKWSFVAVKTNLEVKAEEHRTKPEEPSYPSVELYAGKSLLHSELLKSGNSQFQSPTSTGDKSKLFQNTLVVEGSEDEETAKKSPATKAPPKSPSSLSATEVKKELDGQRGSEVKGRESQSPSHSSSPSLPYVKQEVVESSESTPPPSSSSSLLPSQGGGPNIIMYKIMDGQRIPLIQDERAEPPPAMDRAVKAPQPSSLADEPGKRCPPLPQPQMVALSKSPQPQSINQPPWQPGKTADKRGRIASSSASPSSPRTPNSVSSEDSVSFTLMQARLYKKLLQMYNMDSNVSQPNSTAGAAAPPNLKSLPLFPTQPPLMSSLCGGSATSSRLAAAAASSAVDNDLAATSNRGPPPFRRSLSSHSESEQQTYIVRRNPVQRISVLPTPRNTLAARSDSPVFQSQSPALANSPATVGDSDARMQEADPNVPLNLSSRASNPSSAGLSGGSNQGRRNSPHSISSHQSQNLDFKEMSSGKMTVPDKPTVIGGMRMPSLIHHSQVGGAPNWENVSAKNGERDNGHPSSVMENREPPAQATVLGSVQGVRPGFLVSDLPHITKSVSEKTASLVRSFLAQQPIHSGELFSSTLPSNSPSYSVLSPRVSPPRSPLVSLSKGPASFSKSKTTSISSLPSHAHLDASPSLADRFVAVTASVSKASSARKQGVEGRGLGDMTSSDPKFLHQGRVIDLSQNEDSGEASKSLPVGGPPAGKIVGFSGAILSLSPSKRNGPHEDKRLDKSVRDVSAKVPKKRGRKSGSGKPASGSADGPDATPNKINLETDRKLKKFLGLKQAESPASSDQGSLNSFGTSNAASKPDLGQGELVNPPVIETVGIFSGDIQHVKVGKPQMSLPPAKASSAKVISPNSVPKPSAQSTFASERSPMSPLSDTSDQRTRTLSTLGSPTRIQMLSGKTQGGASSPSPLESHASAHPSLSAMNVGARVREISSELPERSENAEENLPPSSSPDPHCAQTPSQATSGHSQLCSSTHGPSGSSDDPSPNWSMQKAGHLLSEVTKDHSTASTEVGTKNLTKTVDVINNDQKGVLFTSCDFSGKHPSSVTKTQDKSYPEAFSSSRREEATADRTAPFVKSPGMSHSEPNQKSQTLLSSFELRPAESVSGNVAFASTDDGHSSERSAQRKDSQTDDENSDLVIDLEPGEVKGSDE